MTRNETRNLMDQIKCPICLHSMSQHSIIRNKFSGMTHDAVFLGYRMDLIACVGFVPNFDCDCDCMYYFDCIVEEDEKGFNPATNQAGSG